MTRTKATDLPDHAAKELLSKWVPLEVTPKTIWPYSPKPGTKRPGVQWHHAAKMQQMLSDILDASGGRCLRQVKFAKQLHDLLLKNGVMWTPTEVEVIVTGHYCITGLTNSSSVRLHAHLFDRVRGCGCLDWCFRGDVESNNSANHNKNKVEAACYRVRKMMSSLLNHRTCKKNAPSRWEHVQVVLDKFHVSEGESEGEHSCDVEEVEITPKVPADCIAVSSDEEQQHGRDLLAPTVQDVDMDDMYIKLFDATPDKAPAKPVNSPVTAVKVPAPPKALSQEEIDKLVNEPVRGPLPGDYRSRFAKKRPAAAKTEPVDAADGSDVAEVEGGSGNEDSEKIQKPRKKRRIRKDDEAALVPISRPAVAAEGIVQADVPKGTHWAHFAVALCRWVPRVCFSSPDLPQVKLHN